MDDYVGIVCGACSAFCPLGALKCARCGCELVVQSANVVQSSVVQSNRSEPDTAEPTHLTVKHSAGSGTAEALSQEERMEQARSYVCKECSSPVPAGHKFCGSCGAAVPPEIQNAATEYFGSMQAPGKARLILIRGDQGVDGLSYLLQGTEHVAGRRDAQILFPDDPWLSPRHANFVYRGEKLVVRDEGSVNGVYHRVRGSVPIEYGDYFLCGEQVFRLDASPPDNAGQESDGTFYYSSPKRPSPFRLVQILVGGLDGMVVCARDNTAAIGREDADMNYPEDIYMSATHAEVERASDGNLTLKDCDSRNGTYIRVRGEKELTHGDYLFLGKQLLRVEMTV